MATQTFGADGTEDKIAFRLRGAAEPVAGSPGIRVDDRLNLVSLTVKAEFRPGPARSVEAEQTQAVSRDDLVEVEFEDGITVWLTGEDYQARFVTKAQRGNETDKDLLVPETLDVLPHGMQARGPIGWVIKSLKVIGVDPHGMAATKIARVVEEKVAGPKRPGLGFYRCAMETGTFRLDKPRLADKPAEGPVLVFLHGTASSSWGSFGDLWSESRREALAAIRSHYKGNVYAFEHRTLTESPLENTRDLARHLAEHLPKGTTVDLVSHSRGGLVGELLCRVGTIARGVDRTPDDSLPFDEDDFALFSKDPAQADNRAALKELATELERKSFRVGRFVRVACPALGTTLASRKLDRWLSVVGTVAKVSGLNTPVGEAFQDIGEFVAAVIQERTDPTTLAGLEAMMPESPLVRLVNWREVEVDGDLTVVAGDIQPDAWWAKLLVWATDRFYEGDHDLVVNTQSMFGGAARGENKALLSPHKGPNVNHFTYFGNDESADKVVRALTRNADDISGFELLIEPTVDIARAVARSAAAGPRPVVFVLPGIMGSELEVKGNRVWVDPFGLAFGEFTKLRIDARRVKSTNAYARAYGELIEYLGGSHKVIEFPFDWRLSIEQEAARLAQQVETELHEAMAHNLPVRILAHSMGGLVARTMIAKQPQLWTEVCKHPDARLVMLGTPNGGSHAITEMLVGRSKVVGMLALLDFRHSEEDLLEVASRFPGILAMLPKDLREDFFSAEVWGSYHQRDGNGWVTPDGADLEIARAFRELMDNAPLDPERMCYVAGSADATVAEMFYDPSARKIRFNATTRGDGRVTWESGIPQGVPTWYMDVEHGDLTAHPPAFPALYDLLETGTTARLPHTPPVSRTAEELFPARDREIELYPDPAALAAAAFGAGSRKHRVIARTEPLTTVRVVHGNLASARYPVAVGHYAGDPIISAESALNNALDGELQRRHSMGIYPGPVETCAVFRNPRRGTQPNAKPEAAIVMGLGQAGELTGSSLSLTFTRALLEYALRCGETALHGQRSRADDETHALGVCALLVGSAAGGISVAESVQALIRGLCRANAVLGEKRQPLRFRRFEIIELYEDQAIQAVRALGGLGKDPSVRDKLDLSDAGTLKSERGGLARITFVDPPGWWDRIQILGDRGGSATGELRFLTLTRRARNELRTVATQAALVDTLVHSAIRSTHYNANLARALYERLVPNEIKDQLSQRDNVMLMVDEAAARFPWELMEDAFGSGAKPLSVEHCVIRQLATSILRESPALVGDARALVVGDPVSEFAELKGAQVEAREVATRLERNGFEVHKSVRRRAADIVQQFYAHAYKVLHLAGHGVYNYLEESASHCDACGGVLPGALVEKRRRGADAVTGMVLGDGLYLTPAEVKQMRQVPELVFINCCHLGRIETDQPEVEFNRLAANLATEFIRMGVRVVVAAGWAVDDGAAKTFAETFYERLLRGGSFGEAVKDAREATYDARPGTNTWGAYQCYGDPDYCLVTKGHQGGRDQAPNRFASVNELAVAVETIDAALKDKAGIDTSDECSLLESYEQYAKDRNWIDACGCQVRLALARAYGEAEVFDKAVAHYDEAYDKAASSMTFRDLEQRPNVRARAAVERWRKGEAAAERIDDSIRELKTLLDMGETVERLSLLGSTWRRRAWISPSPGRSLKEMEAAYASAYALSGRLQKPDAYPLLNVMVAGLIMQWYPATQSGAPGKRVLRKYLSESRGLLPLESLGQHDTDKNWDPWLAYMAIDRQVLEALIDGDCESKRRGFASDYLEVRRCTSPREFASVQDNLEFLYTLATRAKTPESQTVAACIGRLMSDLST